MKENDLSLLKRKQLAKILARYFTQQLGDKLIGPCACNAPKCIELRCSHFWESILEDPKYLYKAISLLESAEETIKGEWDI